MNRRRFLQYLAAGGTAGVLHSRAAASPADFTLRIQNVTVELTPKHHVKTIGYNGSSPGPIIRVPEGKNVSIDVINGTAAEDIVHWHGLHIPSNVDGAAEEGTPVVAPGACNRHTFTAAPSGTRWYHTHMPAHKDVNRGLYTGQFGFFYIEPRNNPGDYDAEFFLALKEWDPYWSMQVGNSDSLDVAYQRFSINDRSLGFGEPLRVQQGQRVMLRILNASATLPHSIALPGHRFKVVALDGNPVPAPQEVEVLELGPAERIDAVVTMNTPGVWILGAAEDHDRVSGMGVVVEYAGQSGQPLWRPPGRTPWNYTQFGTSGSARLDDETLPLVFKQKFVSPRSQDKWTINGKEFPHTDPIQVHAGRAYRLIFDNRSQENHPIHLHRHTFELIQFGGIAASGIRKDVVMVPAKTQVHARLVANNPGPTLFHCHNQMHMDFGFMALFEYV